MIEKADLPRFCQRHNERGLEYIRKGVKMVSPPHCVEKPGRGHWPTSNEVGPSDSMLL